MIATEDLIRQLAGDAPPRRPGAAVRRLAGGIAPGSAVSLAIILLWLGQPFGAIEYTGIPAFTMKLAFAVAMFALAAALLFAAGRPGRKLGSRLFWLLVPPALVGATAMVELATKAPQFREDAWLGSTWQTCLAAIVLMAIPVFAGILWAFRRLAPTNLRIAGTLAGLASGSAAAVLYALYCPETTATFLISWYSLGILAAGLIGGLAGPRLLRW